MVINKKHGLGKGLGALIPEHEDFTHDKEVCIVNINLIKANDSQPRKSFDEGKILQLAESIKEHGIIQPIVLKKQSDVYIIVAGERRWRAAKRIGLKEMPAVVMELTDKQVLEISLIENIQREDLNPIDEAIAYKRLIEEFSLTQEVLALRVGKSRTAITNILRLLNLDRRVQDYLIDGVISEGHGRALLSISEKELQYKLAQTIIDEGLSVREIEKLIKDLDKKPIKNAKIGLNPFYLDMKNKLENHFGTRVLVSNKNNKSNKGKIEIEYYSQDDLQRILDIINI